MWKYTHASLYETDLMPVSFSALLLQRWSISCATCHELLKRNETKWLKIFTIGATLQKFVSDDSSIDFTERNQISGFKYSKIKPLYV